MSIMEKTPDHRNCLACAFPFWAQLTADEQEMLCRYTRPVHYRKGARPSCRFRNSSVGFSTVYT